MKKIFIFALFCFANILLYGQPNNILNRHFGWLGGVSDSTVFLSHFSVNTVLGFSNAMVEGDDFKPLNFEHTTAASFDQAAILIPVTNGCQVWIAGAPVKGGGVINPGVVADSFCSKYGYIVPQGAVFLRTNSRENFFLIHAGARFNANHQLRLGPLYYSNIIRYGLEVERRNRIIFDGDLSSFTVVKHANGRDWWILMPENGNRLWRMALILKDKVLVRPNQLISTSIPKCDRYDVSATSLDGTQVANWGSCGVSVAQFDRCSGLLSTPLFIPSPTRWIPGGGLLFSPSGRYLYASDQICLYRADLETIIPRFDTVRFSFDPWDRDPRVVTGNVFHHLTYGIDGKVYVSVPHRASFYHEMSNLDAEKVLDVTFKVKHIQLPRENMQSLPYSLNLRLGVLQGSACDSLGITDTDEALTERLEATLYPNPAANQVFMRLSQALDTPVSVRFYDSFGRLMYAQILEKGQTDIDLSVQDWPAGMYFWNVIGANNRTRSGKLSVQR